MPKETQAPMKATKRPTATLSMKLYRDLSRTMRSFYC